MLFCQLQSAYRVNRTCSTEGYYVTSLWFELFSLKRLMQNNKDLTHSFVDAVTIRSYNNTICQRCNGLQTIPTYNIAVSQNGKNGKSIHNSTVVLFFSFLFRTDFSFVIMGENTVGYDEHLTLLSLNSKYRIAFIVVY